MISLPNSCKCSDPSVFPKDWKTQRASLKKDWRIQYRFYLPTGDKRVFIKKGMNEFKDLTSRQEATRVLMADLLESLKDGYNPFTGKSIPPPPDIAHQVDPSLPIRQAMDAAFERLTCKPSLPYIKSTLKYVNQAIRILGYSDLPISKVTRRHIYAILDECSRTKKMWSNSMWNHYRTNLHTIFSLLEDIEAVEQNPVTKVRKKEHTTGMRTALTLEERSQIDQLLKAKHPAFHRFVHIFFHSGCRLTEILQVQRRHVDLSRQRFQVTVKKGKGVRVNWRTIKDVALPLWEEMMLTPGEFLFSRGLIPGPKAIRAEQITRRWNVHIKKGLGIQAGFYTLKHMNVTETMDILDDARLVAAQTGHADGSMIGKVYDLRGKDRNHEKLKKVGNIFA